MAHETLKEWGGTITIDMDLQLKVSEQMVKSQSHLIILFRIRLTLAL